MFCLCFVCVLFVVFFLQLFICREAMNLLLPQLYGIIMQLMPDDSQQVG